MSNDMGLKDGYRRNIGVDLARTFAILLMVQIHFIQFFYNPELNSNLFDFIEFFYGRAATLFYFLAGIGSLFLL